MEPEAVIANARGEIDERLLTGTEGGILSRPVLADDPLIAYLHEEEVLQYLLAGAAAPTVVRGGQTDPIETEGSYRTLLAVTDGRLLVVAGSGDGDRAVSLSYEEIAAIEHSAGVLTHAVLVRETPDRGLEIEVASGSDPAEAVAYARQRVETATGSDEWAVPGKDESPLDRDSSVTASADSSWATDESRSAATDESGSATDGADEVQFGHRPEASGTADAVNSVADSEWGLADWAHEVATARPNEAVDEPNEPAPDDSTHEPATGRKAESATGRKAESATGRKAESHTSVSTDASPNGRSSGTRGVDRISTTPAKTSRTSPDSPSSTADSAPSRTPTDSTRDPSENSLRESGDPGAQPGSDPGAQPDLGAWIDSGSASGSGDRSSSDPRSGDQSIQESAEPGLVESLFEALVGDGTSGIEGDIGGDLGGLVREVAHHARQVDEHLDAGATGDARFVAATANALGAEVERIAAERDRPELRDRIERLRGEVRRAVVATEFGVDPEELVPGSGPSGADPGEILRRLMQGVDPYDFEHLVADLWEALGYQTAVTQSSQDLGVDVVARQVTPVEQTVVIQAKRYGPNTKVGREEIQQYASLHRQERDADLVVVVTTGEFTGPAEEAAEDLNVKLVDGGRLAELIEEYDLYDVVVGHAGETIT